MAIPATSLVLDNVTVEGDGKLNSLILPPLVQATSLNGTLTLTTGSPTAIVLTGTATGYSVVLQNCTTEEVGYVVQIYNVTNQTVNVKNSSGTILTVLAQQSVGYGYLQTAGTANGVWIWWQTLISSVASGVISYNVTSSTAFTTSSVTPALITGLTVTPQAGTYAIWYNSDATCTQNNSTVTHQIFRAAVAVADSLRRTQSVSANFIFQQSTQSIVTFNGSQTCDVRVSTNQGSTTINGRSLLLIRLGT